MSGVVRGDPATDLCITANSGHLDKLRAGDLVLADQGLIIQGQVGFHCAEVETLAFTRSKKTAGCCWNRGQRDWTGLNKIQNLTCTNHSDASNVPLRTELLLFFYKRDLKWYEKGLHIPDKMVSMAFGLTNPSPSVEQDITATASTNGQTIRKSPEVGISKNILFVCCLCVLVCLFGDIPT